MTKGLRCPNCDTTIHRKTVHDWIVNKRASYLRCGNQFCNVRWSRKVLKANEDQFSGKAKPAPKKPKKAAESKPIPIPRPVTTKVVIKRPARRTDTSWQDKIRIVARQFAEQNGVVSVDDLRKWADKNHLQPPNSSSWGSVFQNGEWKKVSQKRSSYSSARSRKVTVWALKHRKAVAV